MPEEWKCIHVILPVTTIDGERVVDLVARRRINGKWEYRRPTQEENEEYVKDNAW